jgi:glycosyltransferase involved in cell wall biosynthesis
MLGAAAPATPSRRWRPGAPERAVSNRLTVVMTGLDEGAEVDLTLASIRDTAGDAVDIVFVNDASADGHDYAGAARRYGAAYVENPSRRGSGRARDIGIEHVETPLAILVDSHMRFHEDDWWLRVEDAIAGDPRAIYCTKCEPLDQQGEVILSKVNAHGAWIQFEGEVASDVLEPKWIRHSDFDAPVIDVPCVLGAMYAFDVSYYKKLGGLLGIRGWGVEEVYLSLKAWLEGGRCRLLTDVEIGHKFKEEATYPVFHAHVYYNKLLVCETVLPRALGERVRGMLADCAEDKGAFARTEQRIAKQASQLYRLREYYAGLFTRPFEEVRMLSEAVRGR